MFTLIANKPNSSAYDRCGSLEARYQGDFVCENMISRDELTPMLIEYMFRNKCLGYHEEGYGFIIFQDGIKVYDSITNSGTSWNGNDNAITWDGGKKYGYETEEYWANFEQMEIDREKSSIEISQLIKEAQAEADKKWAIKAEKDRLAKEAKERAEALRELEYKKLELERLEAKLKPA